MDIKSFDKDKFVALARDFHQAGLYAHVGHPTPSVGKLTLQSITRSVVDSNGDTVEITYHEGDAEFDAQVDFWKAINDEPLALPKNFMSPMSACGFESFKELKSTMEKYHRGQIDQKAVEATVESIVDKQRSTYVELGFDAEEFMPQLLEDVYEVAYQFNVSGAYTASWYDSRPLAAEYNGHTGNTKDTIYYDAKYYYSSEEMKTSLREWIQGLAKKYGVVSDESDFSLDERDKRLSKCVYYSYNTYVNFSARTSTRNGNMLDEDMVPPKGLRFFYKSNDTGTNLYPAGLSSGSSPKSVFDGVLRVWYKDWSFAGRVPMDGTLFSPYINMGDLVKDIAGGVPEDIVSFLKNFDFHSQFQNGEYLSTHPSKYKL